MKSSFIEFSVVRPSGSTVRSWRPMPWSSGMGRLEPGTAHERIAGRREISSQVRPPPREHDFVGSKAAWHEITDTLPQYDEWPPECGKWPVIRRCVRTSPMRARGGRMRKSSPKAPTRTRART